MPDKLEFVEDAAAEAWLAQPELLAAWNELARADPKLTVIQEPPFVTTWYRLYRESYRPILCLAYDSHGQLTGLLPLAQHRRLGTLTHAGGSQAEYHGWICRPELQSSFPLRCLTEITRRYAPRRWVWRWLPPGADTSWLAPEVLRSAGIFIQTETQDSPVVELHDEAQLQSLRSSKSLKSKRNRLKRLGDFEVERISDWRRALELMPFIRRQYDFRQRAMNDVSPFCDDRHKARFYVERLRFPEANHFTALWAGGRPLAFHLGARGEDRVILELITYDPREARNSPAHVLLVELLQLLKQEGIRTFDLTPGGDEYKERYSNATQQLVAPTFFASRNDFLLAEARRQTRQLVKRSFLKVGLPPQRVLAAARKVAQTAAAIKASSGVELLQQAGKVLFERQEYSLYRLKDKSELDLAQAPPRDPEVRIQQYQNLLDYRGAHPWFSQRELLVKSLRKLAAGEVLYLVNSNGGVVNLAWMKHGGERISFKKIDLAVNLPPGSVLIYDFYNNGECCYDGCPCSRNLRQMVTDSLRSGASEVFVGINGQGDGLKRVVEQAGFTLSGRLYDDRLLWWRRKGVRLAPGKHRALADRLSPRRG